MSLGLSLGVGPLPGLTHPWDAGEKLPDVGRDRRAGPLGKYLNCDDPRQGLAGVGTTLDGDAQGGCTFLHSDQGGCGLQESGLRVRRRAVTKAVSVDRPSHAPL